MRDLDKLPAIAAIQALPGMSKCLNSYTICESIPEFADLMESELKNSSYRGLTNRTWNGGMIKDETIHACRHGDLAGVKLADDMMAGIEELARFNTHTWRNRHDVVGGVPNVPAFLAGHPMNMRRRERILSEQAPLTIVADLVSSGGISAKNVRKRGCAILALVRLLSDVRPVELWATVELDAGHGGRNSSGTLCIRLDTAPLDLARVAHILTHPSIPRGLGYAFCANRYKSNVHWAYGSTSDGPTIQRKHGGESFKRALNPTAETLFIPPVFLTDPLIKQPIQWLKDMTAKYGGIEQEAA